jgi:hypothetical protein
MLSRDKYSSLYTITGITGVKKLIPRCSMSGFGPSERMVLWQSDSSFITGKSETRPDRDNHSSLFTITYINCFM